MVRTKKWMIRSSWAPLSPAWLWLPSIQPMQWRNYSVIFVTNICWGSPRLENITVIKPPSMLYFYVCSSIVVIMLLFWPTMLHFYTKNASVIRQRTYIVGVKTWIIQNVCTLHTNICWHWHPQMLADSCSQLIPVLLGPSDDVIQVDELDAIVIHMVL